MFITLKEYSKKYKISFNTLYNWIKNNKFKKGDIQVSERKQKHYKIKDGAKKII